MEISLYAIKFILLIVIIMAPIILLNRLHKRHLKNTFVPYLIFGTIIMFPLLLSIAWWGDFSTRILLSHLGYNFEAMNNVERFKNVTIEDLVKVKNLEKEMLGIGWPLKAILFYLFLYCPYLFIVYLASLLYRKNKTSKNQIA